MRALFLAALAFALVGVGAWLVFSPAPGESAPRALAESASSGASDAERALEAGVSTARAESRPAAADDPELAPAARRADSFTCAEFFRPGDLWVRWLDREGQPTAAPDAVLVIPAVPGAGVLATLHTNGAEQLWRISPDSAFAIALRDQRARLHLDGIVPDAPFVEIAYEPQRTTPLELRLPPHASLVVVVENGGLDLPPSTSCKVSIASNGSRPLSIGELSGTLGAELSIPRVSLDAELELTAIAFRKQLQERRVVRTPSVDGQTARVILSFGASAPLLRGSVRDDLGAPLAETTLQALLKRGVEETGATLLTTPEGRFLWSPELYGDAPWRATFALSTSAGLRASAGELEIPATGVVDLGSLELHARAAGLAGRVVDRNGVPVANAVVQIKVLSIGGEAPPTPILPIAESTLRNAAREAATELPPEAQKEADAGISQVLAKHGPLTSNRRTDEHGRFGWEDARGNDPSNTFLLTATKGFTASEPRTFPGGSRTIELRLEDLGELGGQALLPPGPLPPITLRLRSVATGALASVERERTRVNPKGRFQWFNVPAGRYELDVAFVQAHSAMPLLTLRDLVVPVGGACADLRLEPLDLRPLLAVFTFELRGAPSEREPSRDRLWHRGGVAPANHWTALPSAKGSTHTWILPRGARDFRFDFHRCRRIELRSISEGCVLTAAPAYRVRLAIEPPEPQEKQEPPMEPLSFHLEGAPEIHIQANKISAGIFELETPIPGTMEIYGPIAVTEEYRDGFGGSSPSARIEIADTTELQEFHVQLR